MNSTQKGNSLEDAFYEYLLDQQRRGDLVYGLFPPGNCEIFKKKSYYCKERKGNVQFDIVIELRRPGRQKPFSYVIFECRNYEGSIPETGVTEFSDKLSRIFRNAAKGVLVVSSRLQSGAENVARSRYLGIVKYDKNGLEVVADRSGRYCLEDRFVKSQIFRNEPPVKSLKFSAYHDGKFFGSIKQFLSSVEPELAVDSEIGDRNSRISVPYVPVEQIRKSAQEVLEMSNYNAGPVDLVKICSMLSIELQFSKQVVHDEVGTLILGSANFDRNSIQINVHEDNKRERFTIGHEIGHFCLKHNRYLRSETIAERDLLIDVDSKYNFNYERLEFQANAFSSELVLPDKVFLAATDVGRNRHGIIDRGHGYIFVDDQPCNFVPYNELLLDLSSYFEVSKQAIEIKFRSLGLLTDRRNKKKASHTALSVGDYISSVSR